MKHAEYNEALRLKICGLTREQDVRLCLELGVAMTGFIFVRNSPRYLSPQDAALLPRGQAARVGVFAGHSLGEVREIMAVAKLDYAQLHGGEDADFCRAVGPDKVLKVLWPQQAAAQGHLTLERQCAEFADACSLFLLDAGANGGGSGQTLAWETLRSFSPPKPWLLAGGLGPDNIVAARAACHPDGLDCNSGVELAPGIKDETKLRLLAAQLGL